MASPLSALSASVTRILFLENFPKELKTKDIHAAFAEFDGLNGGFKIKWRDDTSLLIVFNDPSVAKRAYLHTIAYPPPTLSSTSGDPVTIRPYDGPDAQSVIQAVNARSQHHANASRSHNARAASISVIPGARSNSGNGNSHQQHRNTHATIPEQNGREPSPTLPSLPSHPTLNSLISSTLGESALVPSDPAILTTSLHDQHQQQMGGVNGPRIGDPGKRMLGAALGVRHPGLGGRMLNGSSSSGGSPGSASPGPQGHGVDQAMRDVHRAMGGLVVAE